MSRLNYLSAALVTLTLATPGARVAAQAAQTPAATPQTPDAANPATPAAPETPSTPQTPPTTAPTPTQPDSAASAQTPPPPVVVQENTIIAPPPAVVVAPAETIEELEPPPKLTDDHPLALEKSRFRPGKGLHFESADKAFAMAIRLRAQFLYTTEGSEEKGSKFEESFQIRRARLQFGGHVFGADNEFKAELAISPADIGMKNGAVPQTSPLLDFYFQFKQLENLNLRVGQYKVPYSRQRVVSSGDLRLVDRSVVNSEFTLDRDIGVDVRSEDFLQLDMLRYYAGVYLGEGRNTNNLSDFGMMYLARLEFLPLGMFHDYKEGDLDFSDSPKLSLGLGYGYLQHAAHDQGTHGNVPADGGTTDYQNLTADLVFRVLGFSLESEFMWRNGKRHPGDVETDGELVIAKPRDGWGLMAQAGVLLQGTGFEIVARGAANRAVGDSSMTERNEYGLGLNYYFAGHPFKIQADVFRLGSKAPDADKYAWEDRVRVQLQAGF